MPNSPFAIRGVIEGFYGTYYTFPERNDLIRFLGENGFNVYVYGPKNDRQHRVRWWDPYPDAILEEFANTIRIAQEHGITFCYAISFGTPLDHVSPEDFGVVTGKLREFYDRGCRGFGVFLDDVAPDSPPENMPSYRLRAAANDGDFCNRLHDWLQTLAEPCTLCVCPTEYHGMPPFTEYLHGLGTALHPAIDLFYTGPDVCPAQIGREDAAAFADAAGRKPLIWDNYPVNDGSMRSALHIGPLLGRDPRLHESCKGLGANVMTQAEASKIPLLTIADYLACPDAYDPWQSWQLALRRTAGGDSYEALRRFAENSLASPLSREQAPEMTRLVSRALAALRDGESLATSQAVADLREYFDALDESCYHLKNRMRNLALRQDILPWVETLEAMVWMGRGALSVLGALETCSEYRRVLRSLNENAAQVRQSEYRVGGTALFDLVNLACKRVEEAAASGGGNGAAPEAGFPRAGDPGAAIQPAAGSG